MARCACGTGTCSCVVKAANDSVSVVGNGSPTRPYLIGVPGGNPLLNLDVVDSPTLDLTISGSGTATDKRRIQGQATQSLTNLKDVVGTPTEGEIPVWRGTHWEFEAAAAAGLPLSGSWGTAPLDKYGTDSLQGREIYLDVNNQLRTKPDVIKSAAAKLVTDLPVTYPVGTSVMTLSSAQGASWPSGNTSVVVTHSRWEDSAGLASVVQWCYHNNSTTPRAWLRSGTGGLWSPWTLASANVHYAAYKTAAQTMPTANAWYTCTFENIETNEGGITYAAGVFTVPVAGQYAINWSTHIQGTISTSSVTLGLLKNGLTIGDHSYGTTNTNKNWSMSRVVRCAAGDTLAARGRTNVANTTFYGSSSYKYTYIDITLVGG